VSAVVALSLPAESVVIAVRPTTVADERANIAAVMAVARTARLRVRPEGDLIEAANRLNPDADRMTIGGTSRIR
jgi:hypothetical protein